MFSIRGYYTVFHWSTSISGSPLSDHAGSKGRSVSFKAQNLPIHATSAAKK